jgi:hypothetical protein
MYRASQLGKKATFREKQEGHGESEERADIHERELYDDNKLDDKRPFIQTRVQYVENL